MAFTGYRPWFKSRHFHMLVRSLGIVLGCIAATSLLARPALSATLAAEAPPVQEFFVPVPEDQALDVFQTIYPGPVFCQDDNNDPRSENPLTTYISISSISDGTVIYYDHWEDGFEIDLSNPTQATTEIWGDGDLSNGVAPGTADDLITVNTVIVLDTQVDITTRQAVVDYDGGDRIGATRTIAMTRAVWASASSTLLADAIEVYPVDKWGTLYEAPAGVDVTYNELFEYSGLSVMAAEDGTQIGIDIDNDGTTDVVQTLNAGESYLVNGGVRAGAVVSATAPIQAIFLTGDICADYESRWYTLFPREQWSDSYYSPVGTPLGNGTNVFVYNPSTSAITVSWEIVSGLQPPLVVPARSTARALIPGETGSHFFTTDGSPFAAIAAVDSDDGRSDDSANSGFDWGFALVPQSQLTPQTLIGWGAGRDPTSDVEPNENGSPVWVMPVFTNGGTEPVRICADFDGDRAGPLTDARGYAYDVDFLLEEFEIAKIYEPPPPDGDGDQTGMIVYVCDPDPNAPSHALLVAAWGEEPGVASNRNPGLDLGTTAPPASTFESGKAAEVLIDADGDGLASPGDTLLYTIVIRNASRVPIASVTLSDTVPLHTAYVISTTTFDDGSGVVPIADNGSGTPFPLDEGGVSLGELDSDGIFTVTFQVTVDHPFPPFVDRVRNVAIVRANGEEQRPDVETPIDVDPQIVLKKYTNGVDADEPPGPMVAVGSQVTWTYILTNSDIVSVTNVVVTDSVPGVTPVYVSGDTGDDGILAPGETWIYTATGIAIAGQYSNTGTATGLGPDNDPAFSSDVSHYFGVIDSVIDLVKRPSQTSAFAGTQIIYTYTVTNPGSTELLEVTLTDDRCTPLNFVGVDTDGDGRLDPDEIWLYTCSITLTADITNTAVVTAIDPGGRPVSDTDTAVVRVPFLYLPLINTVPEEPEPPEPPAPCPPPNGCPIGAEVKALAVNEATNRLYVVTRNPSSLRLIDPQTNATVATGVTGPEPWGVAVDEDRNRVYVSDHANHDVRVYDGTTLALLGTIALGSGTRPAFIETLPATGDDEVFVVLHGTGRVAVLQGLQRLYDTDAGGAGSFGLAIARNLQHVYVSHRDSRKITVLTRQSGQWALLHPGPETGSKVPFELAYSPSASRLFVINFDSPNWYVDMWKVNAGSDWSFITRQDVPSGGNVASQDVGGAGLEVSRTTGKIYNLNTGADNLSILGVSGDSLFISQTIALGDDPFAIAINNTTQTVFIGLRGPGRLVKIADQP